MSSDYPGLDIVANLDVDAVMANSRSVLETIEQLSGKSRHLRYVPLAADLTFAAPSIVVL